MKILLMEKKSEIPLRMPQMLALYQDILGASQVVVSDFFLKFHETILAISGFSCSESMGMISASVVFYRFMGRLASSVVIRSGRCMLHMHMICT